MRIAIGADHGGYALKEKIKSADSVNQWIDVGSFNQESSNYAEFAQLVAQKVQSHEADFGIVICRSGIGVSIAAQVPTRRHSSSCRTWGRWWARPARGGHAGNYGQRLRAS